MPRKAIFFSLAAPACALAGSTGETATGDGADFLRRYLHSLWSLEMRASRACSSLTSSSCDMLSKLRLLETLEDMFVAGEVARDVMV